MHFLLVTVAHGLLGCRKPGPAFLKKIGAKSLILILILFKGCYTLCGVFWQLPEVFKDGFSTL
jgi:hypothetical protein